MELPLFPLHTVLFPGRPLPLHVFEERYRRMLDHCLEGDGRFGVVAIRNGREAGGYAEVYPVGTVAEIESVRALDDGRSEVFTRGRARFRVLDRLSDDPYPRAEVELLDDGLGAGDEFLGSAVRAALGPYLAALGAPEELLRRLPSKPSALAYLAASALHVDTAEQQRLLELDSCRDRLALVLRMLRREHGLIRHLGAVGMLRPPGPNGCDLN